MCFPQTFCPAHSDGRGFWWRTHSWVPWHSPQTSPEAAESTGGQRRLWGGISSCGRFSIGLRADACHKGFRRQRRSRRASIPLLATPPHSRRPEPATRPGDDPWRERLRRHRPLAAQAMMAEIAGGARTHACRVGTPADTRNFRNSEASARVSPRHSKVRAPLQPPRAPRFSRVRALPAPPPNCVHTQGRRSVMPARSPVEQNLAHDR